MRKIITGDAFKELPGLQGRGAIVTSPPDAEEIGADIGEWIEWFREAAALCIEAADKVCIFYVTDRKNGGALISKPGLLFEAARGKTNLMWHKTALRKPVGSTDLHRPAYSHLIAFNTECKPGKATPDVFERGPVAYKNGMGLKAAAKAVRYARGFSSCIVDPFCGRGTIPAMAEAYGLEAVGVEILEEQAERARELSIRKV